MQYRIYQHGSLGTLLPTQILTEAQVQELKNLDVFDFHLKAGRIVPLPDPEALLPPLKDRTAIPQKPLPTQPKTDDPTAIYREAGKGIVAPAVDLAQDEVDELQELLEGDDD